MQEVKIPFTPDVSLEQVEKSWIDQALDHHGSITAASKSLGISRATMYRKISKYKIDFTKE